MRIHFEKRGKKEIFVGLSDILQGENYSRHCKAKFRGTRYFFPDNCSILFLMNRYFFIFSNFKRVKGMLVAICIDLSSTSPRICTTCIKGREESGLSSRHQFTTSHAIKFKYQRNPALEIMAEISRVIFLSPANRLRVHVLIISFSLFLFLLSMHDSISSGARETCKDLIANFFWKLVNLEGGREERNVESG